MEPESRHVEFGLIELVESFAEVDKHQVAFVSKQREERGLAVGFRFHLAQEFGSFGGNFAAFILSERAPCGPAEAHHLMQGGKAFERERHGRELGGGCGESGRMSRIHGGIVSGDRAIEGQKPLNFR